MSARLIGLARSRSTRPLMNIPMATGTSVSERRLGGALLRRLDHYSPALGRRENPGVKPARCHTATRGPVLRLHRPLQALVHVLDHHDRAIDHRTDRDRDAAE